MRLTGVVNNAGTLYTTNGWVMSIVPRPVMKAVTRSIVITLLVPIVPILTSVPVVEQVTVITVVVWIVVGVAASPPAAMTPPLVALLTALILVFHPVSPTLVGMMFVQVIAVSTVSVLGIVPL